MSNPPASRPAFICLIPYQDCPQSRTQHVGLGYCWLRQAAPELRWQCRLRRAYSVNDTKQLPEWTDDAQGLATPFGKAMREAHDRRSQSSSQNLMPQQEQAEECEPDSSSPRSPGRRSPSKSVSAYASPRSSRVEPARPSSGWVSPRPQPLFSYGHHVHAGDGAE